MSSPTAKTLAVLRKQGLRAQVVERWVPQARRRIDLWGFVDLLYLRFTPKWSYFTAVDKIATTPLLEKDAIVGVQCCAGASHAARRKKILTECKEAAKDWLACGGRIELRSWSKRKVKLKNGKKADRWTERIEALTLEDLQK